MPLRLLLSYHLPMANRLHWQPGPNSAEAEIAYLGPAHSLDLYADGFRRAAEELLDAARNSDELRDSLVYPIVYNLRHAIELTLKKVIWSARRLVDEPGDFPDGHRLDHLWNTCEPVLRRVFPHDQSYALMSATVGRLSELDPLGEGFRYPLSSKGPGTRSPTLSADLRRLDLGALVSDVGHVIDLLDGADFGMDVYMDAKSEMLQIEKEMRAEYEADMRAEYQAEMRAEYAAEMRDDH